MNDNYYKGPGLNFTPEYQVSGFSWITGSIFEAGTYWRKISFPNVAKSFTVINLDAGHIHPSGSASGAKEIFAFFGNVSVANTVQPAQITKNHFVTIPSDKNGFVFLRAVYKYVGAFQFWEPKQVPKTGTQMKLLLQKQYKKTLKLYMQDADLFSFQLQL